MLRHVEGFGVSVGLRAYVNFPQALCFLILLVYFFLFSIVPTRWRRSVDGEPLIKLEFVLVTPQPARSMGF